MLTLGSAVATDAVGGTPAKLGSPRPSSPRSTATLLTLVETPFGVESCASLGRGGRAEVFSPESLAGGESGVSGAAMGRAMERGYRGAGEAVKRVVGWGWGDTICYNDKTAKRGRLTQR